MSTDQNPGLSEKTSAAGDAATKTAGVAAEQGKAVATTAADQARSVAGEAKAQARGVVEEARGQAQQVLGDATSELRQQTDQRLTEAAKAARSTAGQLRALAEGRPEEAGRSAELVQQAGQRLDELADRADELGVQGVANELMDFARRRPVVFLAGAAAAGFVAGRMLRNVKAANQEEQADRPTLPATTDTTGVATFGELGGTPASGATAPGLEGAAPIPSQGRLG